MIIHRQLRSLSFVVDVEENGDSSRIYHHHVSRHRSASRDGACRSRSSHSTNGGKKSKCSTGSNESNRTRPSGKTSSSRSSGTSTKVDYNVKGSSAVILTPDTIVYNDEGLWSHKYDASRPMDGAAMSSSHTSHK